MILRFSLPIFVAALWIPCSTESIFAEDRGLLKKLALREDAFTPRPAEPSPVISSIPPGDPEKQQPASHGGGLIGRWRERREAAGQAIPMQQGTIGDPTLSDRKPALPMVASVGNEKPKSQPKVKTKAVAKAPAKPPLTPTKSESEKPEKIDPVIPAAPPKPDALSWEVPSVQNGPAVTIATAETPPIERPRLALRRLPEPVPRPVSLTNTGNGGHFVVIRENAGGELIAGTVLRFLEADGGHRLRARTLAGQVVELEMRQVRDATFDEAVVFIQTGG